MGGFGEEVTEGSHKGYIGVCPIVSGWKKAARLRKEHKQGLGKGL